MSQQDVQIVRASYEAFNRLDIPAVLAIYDGTIEWTENGGGRAPVGTFRGSEAVARDVFGQIPLNFSEFRAEPERFIDAGEDVLVIGRFRGKAKTGATLDTTFVHVQRVQNGKVTRFQNYVDMSPWSDAWA